MERLICQNCGQPLQKEGDLYVCPHCGATYQDNQAEQAAALLDSALEAYQIESLSKARRALYDAVHTKYPSDKVVIAASTAVLAIRPEDFLARFYLHSHDGDPYELISILAHESVTSCEAKEAYLWLLRSLDTRIVGAIKDFADRHLEGKEKTEALNAIEEEAKKVDEGIYDLNEKREVFLCYSAADMPRVIEVMNLLEENGLHCFAAFRNLRHGKGAQENYQNAIFTAMKNARVFVFLSSVSSRSRDRKGVVEELDHLKSSLPNKPRVEFLLEDYSPREVLAKKRMAEIFKNLEHCRDEEDLVLRVSNLLDAEENAEKERLRKLTEEATKKAREELRAEYEAREAERRKREAEEAAIREKEAEARKAKEAEEKARREKEAEERKAKEAEERERRAQEAKRLEEERLALEKERLELEKKKAEAAKTTSSSGPMDAEAFLKMQEEAERLRKQRAEEERKQQEAIAAAKERQRLVEILKIQAEKAKEREALDLKSMTSPEIQGDVILFGKYPQTKVTDASLIDRLSKRKIEQGAYLECDGREYERVGDEFFRVEPIRWRILQKYNEQHRNERLLISESYLDAHRYDPDRHFGREYESSEIRKWLNEEFLQKAFPNKDLLMPGNLGAQYGDKTYGWMLDTPELFPDLAFLPGKGDTVTENLGITDYCRAKNGGRGPVWSRASIRDYSLGNAFFPYLLDPWGVRYEDPTDPHGFVRVVIRLYAGSEEENAAYLQKLREEKAKAAEEKRKREEAKRKKAEEAAAKRREKEEAKKREERERQEEEARKEAERKAKIEAKEAAERKAKEEEAAMRERARKTPYTFDKASGVLTLTPYLTELPVKSLEDLPNVPFNQVKVIRIPASFKQRLSPDFFELVNPFSSPWDALERIEVDPKSEDYRSWNGLLFTRDYELLCCPRSYRKDRIVIPFKIKRVAHYAFSGCRKLRRVALLEVGVLGKGVFNWCDSLEMVYLAAEQAPLNNHGILSDMRINEHVVLQLAVKKPLFGYPDGYSKKNFNGHEKSVTWGVPFEQVKHEYE